jgi:hypothetical protein
MKEEKMKVVFTDLPKTSIERGEYCMDIASLVKEDGYTTRIIKSCDEIELISNADALVVFPDSMERKCAEKIARKSKVPMISVSGVYHVDREKIISALRQIELSKNPVK